MKYYFIYIMSYAVIDKLVPKSYNAQVNTTPKRLKKSLFLCNIVIIVKKVCKKTSLYESYI